MMIKYLKYVLVILASFIVKSAECQEKQKKWYIPDHYKAQYAGNIGFVSFGAGYLHGKDKLETDFFTGYVPEAIGGDRIMTLTLKSTYAPWKKLIRENLTLRPFSVGLYLNYSFGSQFDTISPNEYPEGYYWWATSLRVGGFIGGTLTLNRKEDYEIKRVSLYYELGTYDLIFLSFLQNTEYLRIWDVTSLALGVKFEF
ncbi:MAG: hypothetical protein ABJH05_18710 [Fulvivirga sp.]